MEPKYIKRFILFLSRFTVKSNQKYLVFSVFLFLSTLFWFLNELNQETETNITFPVRYTGVPSGKVILNELPEVLQIRLSGPGYTLLRYVISPGLDPFVFDLKNLPFRQISGEQIPSFYLLTSYAREMLDRQLPPEVSVVNVLPDTIYFVFDDVVSRKVKVESRLAVQYEKQFMQNGNLVITPDSVVVSGARASVDTIGKIFTKLLEVKKINRTIERSVALDVPPSVMTDLKRVDVRIPVEQFTESVTSIPIETTGVPDSLEMKVFPGRVQLTFLVALSDFPKVQPQLFRAVVDFSDHQKRPDGRLGIHLTRYPDYIQSMRMNPLYVEYIIEAK